MKGDRKDAEGDVALRQQPCGECRACCFVYPLNDKPARQWCKHSQPGIGCDCYPRRPNVCRGYQCQWKGSELPAYYRPDTCGIIGTYRLTYRDYPVIVASEVWPGAAELPVGKDLIEIIMHAGRVVCVCLCDGRSWMLFRHLDLSPEDGWNILEQLASDTAAGLGKQSKMDFAFGSCDRR
jgi:hypothetical protein